MTDTAKLIAQAREDAELFEALADALEAAEAELAKRPRPTLDGQLVADNASLHARLEAAEALKDDATMLWNDANKRAVAAEAERDEWKRKYEAHVAASPTDTEFYGR